MKLPEFPSLRRWLLPALALCGFSFALFTVVRGSLPPKVAAPVADPSRPPFESYVAGTGIVEASSENIAIGATVPGIVTEVSAKPGERVQAGDPLFRVDDRDLRAELLVRQANLLAAKARLDRLAKLPRAEDLPPAQARVRQAEASLEDLRGQIARWESVADKRAVNADDLAQKRAALAAAAAKLEEAQAALALLQAGAFRPDLEVAQAEADAAKAQIAALEIEIDRRIVRAPVAGEVLQVKIRKGEYAPAGAPATPLMIMGTTSPLHVRVDVDENDAWRVRAGAKAEAFVRGNREIRTPLEFVRIEPFVVPKRSLTGDSSERVDTRVLQAIFRFERGELPILVGQQMDVFIEAPPTQGGAR